MTFKDVHPCSFSTPLPCIRFYFRFPLFFNLTKLFSCHKLSYHYFLSCHFRSHSTIHIIAEISLPLRSNSATNMQVITKIHAHARKFWYWRKPCLWPQLKTTNPDPQLSQVNDRSVASSFLWLLSIGAWGHPISIYAHKRPPSIAILAS